MEVYFTVSQNGQFVFRTSVFGDDPQGVWRAEMALEDAFDAKNGYHVERNERPSTWTSKVVVGKD